MRKIFFILGLFLWQLCSYADEGMWIPMLLQQLNEQEMHNMGMKLTAEDIYNINRSCLKDAILLFGGGCTAEIVSDQGLILTNHHCGISYVQSLSTMEQDYLDKGFWAKTRDEELPCKGLSVTLLVRMEDVTEAVLKDINAQMKETIRDSLIKAHIKKLETGAINGTHYEAKVKGFYYGNQYYLFVTEVFKDVRLAGAPPASIGKFGGDTDNWMWPRHTGDFSVFRIYADKDGNPVEYSKDNVPYKPKYHIPISLKGYQEGDFTFVYGYPGTTQEYVSSFAVNLISQVENPVRIRLRDIRLQTIDRFMNVSRLARLRYTAKAAGIANGWKKWQGENRGIKRLDVINKKKTEEAAFQTWVEAEPSRKSKYGTLLKEFDKVYQDYKPLDLAYIYYNEAGNGIELLRFVRQFTSLINLCSDGKSKDEDINKAVAQLKKSSMEFFRNYIPAIDREIMPRLLNEYAKNTGKKYCPPVLKSIDEKLDGNFSQLTEIIFNESFLVRETEVQQFLNDFRRKDYKKITREPVYKLALDISNSIAGNIMDGITRCRQRIDSLQRIYMKAQIEMAAGKRMYPDANLSLRVAYGKVKGYKPADAVNYLYFTTLDGIMQKEDTAVYDLVVDPKLKDLYQHKDYGPFADKDGKMHTCFIATNHTSGGNSGSPVFNADGELIGINFDRCWEGTMSDIVYDPEQCRNISLDIRYCLFIIEKLCGAGNLVSEMTLR